ncbi:MAG: RidA family protein [Pseudomonadota bacterium]
MALSSTFARLGLAGGLAALSFAASAVAETEYYRDATLPDGMPFSSAVVVGDLIFLSGHLGRIPETGALIEGGVGAETTQTFRNISSSLSAVGASLSDIVSCTVFLDDLSDFPAMNEAYAAEFPGDKPARATLGADGLALGAKVEIQCIAARPGGE